MTFTDVTDLTQLFSETLARVRARLDADANAGLTQEQAEWVDTREGSFYWDVTQPPAMEIARLWDAMTETAAAAFVSTAWGEYLDEHGRTFELVRDAAVAARGSLTFVARQATLIEAGTAASSFSSPLGQTVTVRTTEAGTTSEPLASPSGVTVLVQGTGGVLEPGTRYYHVTALNEYGETTGSADAVAVATTTSTRNWVSWNPVPDAAYYRIYRAVAPGSRGGLIGSTVGTTFLDDGTITPQSQEPQINLTSGITLPAVAVIAGVESNIAEGAITSLDSVIPTVYSVTNRERFRGGQEAESDNDFRLRIIQEYVGTVGGGNVTDYRRWVIERGVARVSVIPVWAGPGTVLVIAMMRDGSPVTPQTVWDLQTFLDPQPGQGLGQAPIGAHVTASTSTIVELDINAEVICQHGFSIEGTRDTIAVRNAISASLSTYLNSLGPGDEVVFEHIEACFFVPGVLDIGTVTVNGQTGRRYPLGTGITPQVARLGTLSLTEPPTPSPWH